MAGIDEWPSFYQLSEVNNPDDEYYTGWDKGVLRPAFHWCYLAEITAPQYHPFRTSLLVKDRNGTDHPIIFYVYDEVPPFRNPFALVHDFKVGYTIAILYAERKMFMDLSEGIRQENEEFKIFKCPLAKLLEEAKKLESLQKECYGCGKNDVKVSACGNCKLAYYCGKECQKIHWREVHKGLCHEMILLKRLLSLMMKKPFRRYSSFQNLTFNIDL